ncbi:MAG: phage antirepressor, partial [Oscillospiraceae bacterium]|nr:phage antirepressor [Oscillospiraceae bacterium]
MTENEIILFKHEEFGEIRTLNIDGEPWFVGVDIAKNLGYQNGSRDINRHVDEDDRNKRMIFDGNQKKETIVINESGLYSLILSSKLPKAKEFKRWVTSEVLPLIRKHGVYAVDEILADPDT